MGPGPVGFGFLRALVFLTQSTPKGSLFPKMHFLKSSPRAQGVVSGPGARAGGRGAPCLKDSACHLGDFCGLRDALY